MVTLTRRQNRMNLFVARKTDECFVLKDRHSQWCLANAHQVDSGGFSRCNLGNYRHFWTVSEGIFSSKMADYHVRRSRLSSSGSGSDDFEDESLDPRIQVGTFLFNLLWVACCSVWHRTTTVHLVILMWITSCKISWVFAVNCMISNSSTVMWACCNV